MMGRLSLNIPSQVENLGKPRVSHSSTALTMGSSCLSFFRIHPGLPTVHKLKHFQQFSSTHFTISLFLAKKQHRPRPPAGATWPRGVSGSKPGSWRRFGTRRNQFFGMLWCLYIYILFKDSIPQIGWAIAWPRVTITIQLSFQILLLSSQPLPKASN